MVQWGDYYAGECVHGESAEACRVCRSETRASVSFEVALQLIAALLVFAGFAIFGPDAARKEFENDRQQELRHRQQWDASLLRELEREERR